jgi:hypothetical protein
MNIFDANATNPSSRSYSIHACTAPQTGQIIGPVMNHGLLKSMEMASCLLFVATHSKENIDYLARVAFAVCVCFWGALVISVVFLVPKIQFALFCS